MKKNLLGIVLLLVSVLFVGNVYAEKVDFVFGEVNDVTNTNGDTIDDSDVKVTVTHSDDYSEYTFTYDEASLKYVPVNTSIHRDVEAAWVGIQVNSATYDGEKINNKFTIGTGARTATVSTYTIDGKTYTNSGNTAWDGYVWFHVTKEEMEKAIRENNGVYTRKLVITWTNGKSNGEEKKGTQTVTVNVKVAGVTLQAKDDTTTLWDEKIYEETVKKVEAEKLAAEQNANKTEEKDDAPKTNDTFPMALVGMISLGLAGTYTYRKLHN